VVDLVEGNADLDEAGGRGLARQGNGQQADAHAFTAGQHNGLERRLAGAATLPCLNRQWKRPAAKRLGAPLLPAVGPGHAEENVEELGTEDLVQLRLRAFGLPDARVSNHLPDHDELHVGVTDETAMQHEIREGADHEHDRQQNAAVPQRQPGSDRKPSPRRSHSSSFITYPAPRMVWSSGRSPFSWIFRRTYPT